MLALTTVTAVASADSQRGERTFQRVYFEFNSETPTADLMMVANQLQCTPTETIVLDAYADPVGSKEYNAALALRRAAAVRDRLVELGIDGKRIMLSIFGEAGTPQKTHALQRRVEIRTSDEAVATLSERRKANAIAVVEPGKEPETVALP